MRATIRALPGSTCPRGSGAAARSASRAAPTRVGPAPRCSAPCSSSCATCVVPPRRSRSWRCATNARSATSRSCARARRASSSVPSPCCSSRAPTGCCATSASYARRLRPPSAARSDLRPFWSASRASRRTSSTVSTRGCASRLPWRCSRGCDNGTCASRTLWICPARRGASSCSRLGPRPAICASTSTPCAPRASTSCAATCCCRVCGSIPTPRSTTSQSATVCSASRRAAARTILRSATATIRGRRGTTPTQRWPASPSSRRCCSSGAPAATSLPSSARCSS